MSFFSKINKEFDGLFNDDKKKKEEKPAETYAPPADATRAFDQPQYGYGAPPPGQYPPLQQQYSSPAPVQGAYGGPPPQQYGSPPPSVPYESHSTSQFNSPPPIAGGGIPAIPYLPQGWQALWDPTGSRWAYLEVRTSKVNWTVPTGPSFAQRDENGEFGDEYGSGGHGAYGAYGSGHDSHGYAGGPYVDHNKDLSKESKDKDKKNMMIGVAGGLAVGAIGGAIIANAIGDDDDHSGGGGYPQQSSGYGGYPPQQNYSQGPPPAGAPLPDEDHDGSSVSSSDKEDVEEARQEYEEAYEETYGSD